ncbi:uncharacterized protein LOC128559759 [Mercenaria mercenaria]|uniref:uncharacterized protein LOC128559759 n=1 Tax=Mercenaria mercenaria TaxID=6596 RepID=UPI00234F4DB0|nr:uncharacterized protein LOC128559759 [Mercenaria mercenaria]
MEDKKKDQILEGYYYEAKNPAAYAGAQKLFSVLQKKYPGTFTISYVKQWLNDQDAFSLQKPRRHKFKTANVRVTAIGEQLDIDFSLEKMYAFIAFLLCLSSISAWKEEVRDCHDGFCKIVFNEQGMYFFASEANDVQKVHITPRFPNSTLDMRNTANLLYVQIDNIDLPEERMCDVLICYTPLREVIVESSHKTKLCCLGNTSKRTVNVTPTPTPADSTTNPTVKSAILTTAEASVRRQTVSVTPTPTPADSTTNPTVKSTILTTVYALSFSTGFCIIVIVILFIMHKKRIIRLKRLEIRLDRITAEITSSTVTSTAPLVRSLSDPAMSSTRLSEISMIDTSTNTSAVAPVHRYPTRLQSRLLH